MSHNLNIKLSFSSILRFAFPSILMMVVMSLYTSVDGAFVSKLIGTDAMSAINIVYPFFSLMIGLGTMFGSGITAIISTKMGEGKQAEANQSFTFIIFFTIVIGFFLSVLTFIFLDKIIYFLGANEAIFQYCYDYAYPLVFFCIANVLQYQFQSVYIANGKPYVGLIFTLIGGIFNIIFDYYFIAILNMGIRGAALATGLGYLIPTIFGLWYFSSKKHGNIYFVKPSFDFKVLINTMSNGSSEMVSYLSTSITTFLFNLILMRLVGQEGVASISILLYLDFILVAIIMGYSMGVAPLFSFSHGSNQTDRINKLFKTSVLFCTITGISMTLITLLFASQLTQIFTIPGSAVYDLSVTALSIFGFSYLFKGYNIFSSAMFTAFGNGLVSATLSFMRTLVFLVVTLLLFAYLFKTTGVWLATPIAELLSLGLALYFTKKYRTQYQY